MLWTLACLINCRKNGLQPTYRAPMALPSASTVSTGAGVFAFGVATFVVLVVLAMLAEVENRQAKRQAIPINQSNSFFSTRCILVESSSAVLEVSDPKQAHRLRSARSSCSCGSHATRSEGNAAAKGVTRNGVAARRRRKDEKNEADGAASRATIVLIQ